MSNAQVSSKPGGEHSVKQPIRRKTACSAIGTFALETTKEGLWFEYLITNRKIMDGLVPWHRLPVETVAARFVAQWMLAVGCRPCAEYRRVKKPLGGERWRCDPPALLRPHTAAAELKPVTKSGKRTGCSTLQPQQLFRISGTCGAMGGAVSFPQKSP